MGRDRDFCGGLYGSCVARLDRCLGIGLCGNTRLSVLLCFEFEVHVDLVRELEDTEVGLGLLNAIRVVFSYFDRIISLTSISNLPSLFNPLPSPPSPQ